MYVWQPPIVLCICVCVCVCIYVHIYICIWNYCLLIVTWILCASLIYFQDVKMLDFQFSSVQSLSRVWLFATPWTAARQASLSITNSRSSLRLTSTESVIPSNHLILCHPLFLPPLIFPSIRVFSSESLLHIRWSKFWSVIFSISPSNEYSGLTSSRMAWFDLLAVPQTLKSLFQHHSSTAPQFNSSVLRFLYNTTLTSIHDYWKNHNFD